MSKPTNGGPPVEASFNKELSQLIALKTCRLVIRNFNEADLADFLAYQSHHQVRKHMQGEAMGDEQARKYLESQYEMPPEAKGKWHGFAVEHLAEKKMIGDVGYFYQSDKEEADIGFQFHPDHHGNGYAYEASTALLEFIFTHLPIQTVTSGCDKENRASKKLIQKLGLRQSGESNASISFAISRGEWLAKQP